MIWPTRAVDRGRNKPVKLKPCMLTRWRLLLEFSESEQDTVQDSRVTKMSGSVGDEYLLENLSFLRQTEGAIPKFMGLSPQLNQRRQLVDWTCLVAQSLDLSDLAVHLGVRILDTFMDSHDIQGISLCLCLFLKSIQMRFC